MLPTAGHSAQAPFIKSFSMLDKSRCLVVFVAIVSAVGVAGIAAVPAAATGKKTDKKLPVPG
jgi:hypothetical protein